MRSAAGAGEIVLRLDRHTARFHARPKIVRSKKGCFNCRKRKKKCDGTKPNCLACEAKGTPCVWPEGNQSLPVGFTIPPSSTEQKQFSIDTETEDSTTIPSTTNEEISCDNPCRSPIFECLDSELSMESANPKKLVNLRSIDVHTTDPTEMLIISAANGFINSLGSGHTHPLLTATATLTPLIRSNKVVEQVALACGAAFMAFDEPRFHPMALDMFYSVFDLLKDYIHHPDFEPDRDSAWLGTSFQLLGICAKVVGPNDINYHLINAFGNAYSLLRLRADSMFERTRFVDFKGDLQFEIENDYLPQEGPSLLHTYIERAFLDSFVYNYTIAILYLPYEQLPSPFEVYTNYADLIKTPVLNCKVPWMNNPVFGASLNSFEIAAKASFLFRTPGDPSTVVIARNLLEQTSYFTQQLVPFEVRKSPTYKRLKDSILVSDAVLAASRILLLKTINPSLQSHNDAVQREVKCIVKKLKQVGDFAPPKVISPWALMMCGFAAIDDEDRGYVLDQLVKVHLVTHTFYSQGMTGALKHSWGRDTLNGRFQRSKGSGLDVLYHQELMATIIV